MTSITDKVDRLFIQWDKPDSPGCALAIIQNGEIIYKRGYGMANLEYDIPISPNSVFDIASNSKQFTAMCIVLLARENLLNLDDEVQKYIPEIPQYDRPITIRHLICHTSGLRDYLDLMSMSGTIDENSYLTEEIITLIARQKSLNFQPGTEQKYCNTGYFLLGEIVKRVSGKSLRVFAQEQIFTPLGMTNTHFHDDFREIVKNRADAYEPRETGGFQTAMSWMDDVGAGFVYTTVEDLLLWDRNFYKNIIGGYGQDLIKEIITPGKLDNGEPISGAFGLQIGNRGGLKTILHGGLWMGYRSDLIRFPDRHFSVVCLANLGTFNPTKLAFQVADIYLEDKYLESIVKLMPHAVVSLAEPLPWGIKLPLAELAVKTGFYRNPETGSIWELELKSEKLMARVVWMYFQLIPIDATHFQSIDNEIDCDVEFSENLAQIIVSVDPGNGIKVYTLEKILASANDSLTDYVGTYYATELEFSYEIYLQDNNLFINYKGKSPSKLRSLSQDIFLLESAKLEFGRDREGQVSGFDRCSDRVRRLHFSKQ